MPRYQGILPAGAALASASSSSIAGIIVTALEEGKGGSQLMLKRLLYSTVRRFGSRIGC